MMHEAIFRFEGEGMDLIYRSLAPEQEDGFGFRSHADIYLENDRLLVLHVKAGDTSALRAALNMWLRLVNVASEMQEIANHG
ncbi:MAG: KEOPS complex subunit Pcc1 [Methanomicrobiales archaeon]|nr:KEOPS complex subunit Pcc1 [Methanomicrobiales archaeon]